MRHSLPTFPCLLLAGVLVVDNPQCGTHPQDHARLALALLEQGRYDRAVAEARRALRQDGPEPALHLVAAMALVGSNRLDEGLQALGEGLRLEPDDARLHAALRGICQQFGLYGQAQPLLSNLLRTHPDNQNLEATLGWVWVQLGDEERGEALLQQAVAPGGVTFAHLELGRLLMRQERLDEAARVLAQGIEVEPADQLLLLALGETRLRQGLLKEARTAFDRSVSASPEPGRTAARAAQAYYDQGVRGSAIEFYERALEHDPDDAPVLNNLAWTYAEEGVQLDRAHWMALRAVKQAPGNVVYLDTFAELLYRRGQQARAIALVRRALQLEPPDGEHYAYLRGQMSRFHGSGAHTDAPATPQ